MSRPACHELSAAQLADLGQTSLIAHWIRDEIREVVPGMYLGLVYWDDERVLNFVLQFPPSRP